MKEVEETKEILAFDHNLETKNNELYSEILSLKDQVLEHKALHIESLKYKEKLDELVRNGVISSLGREILKF